MEKTEAFPESSAHYIPQWATLLGIHLEAHMTDCLLQNHLRYWSLMKDNNLQAGRLAWHQEVAKVEILHSGNVG